MTEKKRTPMTRQQAIDILDKLLKHTQDKHNVDYPGAMQILQKTKPDVLRGYESVMRRTENENRGVR